MIITLYLANKLYKFRLPSQVSGSYSFDYENHDAKLINVEARDGKWILYKTSDVDIVSNGMSIETVELLPNNFYFLKRDNISYVISALRETRIRLKKIRYPKRVQIHSGY